MSSKEQKTPEGQAPEEIILSLIHIWWIKHVS